MQVLQTGVSLLRASSADLCSTGIEKSVETPSPWRVSRVIVPVFRSVNFLDRCGAQWNQFLREILQNSALKSGEIDFSVSITLFPGGMDR
ncbi:hypothetical protein [Stappia indica]|uniref:hypothetical protein n=1 Tax=Stappia indica TaxID=538381 RepID=UPI0011424B65|nr:hypothetical protein [Stappia indica]